MSPMYIDATSPCTLRSSRQTIIGIHPAFILRGKWASIYISKSVNRSRAPGVNAGLRRNGAEMSQAIRPGVSAGPTRPLPGFLSLPLIPYYRRSPCSRQSQKYMFIASTRGFYLTPLGSLLDYHDYI